MRTLITICIASIAAAACGEPAADETVAAAHDAGTGIATPGPVPFAPDIISDERWHWRISFTPDGDTAYFSVSDGWFPATRTATIMRSTRGTDGSWTEPDTASFSGTWSDMDPFVARDGSRVYFSSLRPAGGVMREVFDIWYVDRTAAGWSEPVRLGREVNSDQDELYASASADGTLYFASGPTSPSAGGSWNIYSARPAGSGFEARQPVPDVNNTAAPDPENPTSTWDFNPEISPDGRTLLFGSLRAGGHGLGDIYVSFRSDDGWSEPRNLGPIVNSAEDEYHPTLSADGTTLYFARARFAPDVVRGRFMVVPVASIFGDAGPPIPIR